MKKNELFEKTPISVPSKNTFDLSHDHKFTCDMGVLVPVLNVETLPGDIFNIKPELFIRFIPGATPWMHRVDVDIHIWFVPYRLCWSEWGKWITGQSAALHPHCTGLTSVPQGSIGDYMGLNPTDTNFKISALPLAAYGQIS